MFLQRIAAGAMHPNLTAHGLSHCDVVHTGNFYRDEIDSQGSSETAAERVASCDAPSSHRPLALHGHPRAGAGVRPVVPHRAVLGAAVVPERDGVFAPAEAALE